MLMSPNKGETAVHGCHCRGDMAVCMPEILARSLVGVCVPLPCFNLKTTLFPSMEHIKGFPVCLVCFDVYVCLFF